MVSLSDKTSDKFLVPKTFLGMERLKSQGKEEYKRNRDEETAKNRHEESARDRG